MLLFVFTIDGLSKERLEGRFNLFIPSNSAGASNPSPGSPTSLSFGRLEHSLSHLVPAQQRKHAGLQAFRCGIFWMHPCPGTIFMLESSVKCDTTWNLVASNTLVEFFHELHAFLLEMCKICHPARGHIQETLI